MNINKSFLTAFIISIIIFHSLFSHQNVNAQVKAFPQAEGFGANSQGGRGGKVFLVTNLNDSGTGSLRDCAQSSSPRLCLFRVAGLIETQSAISIKNPYITIAGQTAPGGGITLKAAPTYDKGSISIKTHDVIIRNIRFRTGASTEPSSQRRGITVEAGARDLIFDHVSVSWATDDNLTLIDGVSNITVQWAILSEGLSHSTHTEGEHSKGLAISGKMFNVTTQTGNITVHHNLLAHNRDRNPRHAAWGLVDVVNNVIYNWGHVAYEANDAQTNAPSNIIGNFFKKGPNSGSINEVHVDDANGHGASLYVQGNIGPNRVTESQPESDIVRASDREYIVSSRFDAPQVKTSNAQTAYQQVLDFSGVRVPAIDSVDTRVINSVKSGTGKIIDSPSEVGGWPSVDPGTPPYDSDNDGMPDAWESERGLNISQNDSAQDRDSDGYTNIEEYINGLVTTYPDTSPQPSPSKSCQLPADIDCSGSVNSIDLSYLISKLGTSDKQADLDNSETVNALDLSILLSYL